MRRRNALVLGPALALVAAAPAAAAQHEVKGLDTLVWDRPDITVAAGDTVRWTFAGTAQPHNVAAQGGNWTYRTELGAPPAPTAQFTFAAAGVYRYVCEVHATTMSGVVRVAGAGGTPPPEEQLPPSQTPFPNDSQPPAVVEIVDEQRPALTRVRASRIARGAKVRFRVSEAARVTARFRRGGKTVKTRTFNVRRGTRSVTVRGLRAGRYRVEVRARDLGGNRSPLRRASVTVR